MLKSVTAVLPLLSVGSQAAGWNYEEPGNGVDEWPNYNPECGYSRQSPIDLPNFDTLKQCRNAPLEIQWTSHSTQWAIRNAGHSLLAIPFDIEHSGGTDIGGLNILSHNNETDMRLQNRFFKTYSSNRNKEYCLHSMHFHWGVDSNSGSEHTVDGRKFPLELHLVHYSCDYENLGPALNDYASGKAGIKYDDENVLAVIGVFFEIGDANPILEKLLQNVIIDGIEENSGAHYNEYLELFYTTFNPRELLPESREYVGYLGSLTTPPCYETVRWHVLKEPLTVSEAQMEKFRRLLEGTDPAKTQAPNWRPVTPLNGRTVYACEEDVEETFADKEEQQNRGGDDDEKKTGDGDKNGDDDESSLLRTEEEEKWMAIAIAFIALFALFFAGCGFLACYLKSTLQRVEALEQAKMAKSQSELAVAVASPASPTA